MLAKRGVVPFRAVRKAHTVANDSAGAEAMATRASPRAEWTAAKRGSAVIGLRVTRSGRPVDQAARAFDVRAASPGGETGISINDGAVATNDRNVTLTVARPLRAQTALISNDGGFGAAGATSLLPVDEHIPWRLTSLANQWLPRIVYARFRGGDAGRETYTDDIILDERRPKVLKAALASRRKSQAYAAAVPTVRLRVTASDDNAGIRQVEVARAARGRPFAIHVVDDGIYSRRGPGLRCPAVSRRAAGPGWRGRRFGGNGTAFQRSASTRPAGQRVSGV